MASTYAKHYYYHSFQYNATIILFILKNNPLFYAPKRLRTYRSRGVNSFKAPNPSLTRFSLPGEDEIVYPDDSPVRRPIAKRSFSTTEISDEFGSPKRRKADHPPSRPSSSSLQLVPPPQDLSLSVTLHGSRREVTTITAQLSPRSRPSFLTRTFPVCSGELMEYMAEI